MSTDDLSLRQLYVVDRAMVHYYNNLARNMMRRKTPSSTAAIELADTKRVVETVKAMIKAQQQPKEGATP
jgi:hypothetical protein